MFKRFTACIPLILICSAFLLLAARPIQETTPQPPTPAPLSIPQAVELALTAGIGFLLTNGLKSFSKALKANQYFTWFPDLSGLATSTTTVIITVLILYGNTILSSFPPEWVPLARGFFAILGTALTAFGIHYTIKNKPPEFITTTLEQIHPPDIG